MIHLFVFGVHTYQFKEYLEEEKIMYVYIAFLTNVLMEETSTGAYLKTVYHCLPLPPKLRPN